MIIRRVGVERVKTAELEVPGLHERLAADHVRRLAENIEEVGMIHLPMVRRRDMQVISGGDRVAAHHLAGREEIDVQIVDQTDTEVEVLRRVENVHRRHDPEHAREEFVELVDWMERQVEQERQEAIPPDSLPQGRPRSPRGEARERVARTQGVDPESVRKREYRARKAKGKVEQAKKREAKGKKPKAPIDTLGLELGEALEANLAAVREYLDSAVRSLGKARGELERLASAELRTEMAELQTCIEQVRTASHLVKGQRPARLCPWCKGINVVTQQCGACNGWGYLTERRNKDIPSRLLKPPHLVMFRGETLDLEEAQRLDGGAARAPVDAEPAEPELDLDEGDEDPGWDDDGPEVIFEDDDEDWPELDLGDDDD